jgi:hypothetical protein
MDGYYTLSALDRASVSAALGEKYPYCHFKKLFTKPVDNSVD